MDGKKYGPGDPVKLSAEDAKYLQAAGFVVPAGAKQESGAGATVGGLRIQGGRPPGSRVV
ncbi:hypothetical protein [Trinickia dinghuensis]|uniref:hypothetical protein n=1 Tax=Trinickia dinghuensis TaxID=2291023 RepID=UPI0011C06D49|nr:hypothetical protein [Trinickia dinghuensis]